jgi:hypothetical protein
MSVLTLNGTVRQVSLPEGTPVREIVERHLDAWIPTGEVVCEVAADGLLGDLEQIRWGQMQELAVRTSRPTDLVIQGLQASGDLVRSVSQRLQACATDLRTGQEAAFRTRFVAAIDDLLSFVRFLAMAQAFIGNKQAVVQQFQGHLQAQVDQLLKTQQAGDLVLLADLLEYELAPIFDGWDGVRTALLAAAERGVAHG